MHREARAANYLLISFSIVSFTLLSLPLSGPVRAFKACATYLLNPIAFYGDKGVERFATVPSRLRELISADMENRAMQERVKQAEWVVAEAEALRHENSRLRSALGLKAPARRTGQWARVMERDPARWYRLIGVDAGADQGVALNSPVLGGLDGKLVAVGRVTEVRPKTSVVLLITDELSSVAAYVVRPSTAGDTAASPSYEGLLQGQGHARMRMNYLSPDAQVQKGDLVYTSPTSATFPPDVLLGSVSEVFALDPFLAFQSVEIQPALDPSRLKEVMILKQAPPTAARVAGGVAPTPEEEPPAQ